jgi:hypothetical protein
MLFGQHPKDCSGKVPVQKSKCCSDKVQTFKVDQGKQTLEKAMIEPVSIPAVLVNVFSFNVPEINTQFQEIVIQYSNAPPDTPHSIPLFLLHRSLII